MFKSSESIDMKKICLIIVGLCFFNVVMSQNQVIKLTNINTNKEKIIEAPKRIKIKTIDGRKIKGRLRIEDSKTISVDHVKIALTDVAELRRNPLLTSILTSGLLIYGGSLTVGFGALIGVLVDPTAFWLLVPAAGMIYTGIKAPNFNKNHQTDKGWRFEIITIPG